MGWAACVYVKFGSLVRYVWFICWVEGCGKERCFRGVKDLIYCNCHDLVL